MEVSIFNDLSLAFSPRGGLFRHLHETATNEPWRTLNTENAVGLVVDTTLPLRFTRRMTTHVPFIGDAKHAHRLLPHEVSLLTLISVLMNNKGQPISILLLVSGFALGAVGLSLMWFNPT